MKKKTIVLLFALSSIAGMSYSQELVGSTITIKDAWDNVLRSTDDGKNYDLIGTYRGWNTNAIYIAGYNYQSNPSYYSAKYISFGGQGIERMWLDLLSGNAGIGTTTPNEKLDVRGNLYLNSGIDDNHIYWGSHYMTLGTKPGDYAHNVLSLKPGGASEGKLVSIFCMFTANSTTSFEQKVQIHTEGNSFFNGGNVGIGTTNPAYKLDVLGTIRAKEVLVNLDGGADFVFEKDYKLLPIEHVANYVQENKHLPDIPSADEMVKNGVSMGDMQVKLLQKVEELTLYAIQQDQSKKELEAKLAKQENQYNALLEKVEMLTKQMEKK